MANITGTANADTLDGTAQNDVIDGLGADDVIRTAGGLDTVHGGDGNDRIGANYFDGFSGTLYGDAGNDLIFATAYRGATTVSGSSGEDRLYLGFYSSYSANTLTGTGGDGNDLVVLGSVGTVDLGAGDDRFISQAGSAQTVTLGAGRDEVVLGFRGLGSTDLSTTTTFDFGSGTSNLTITDFKPGEDRMTFNLKQAWSAASANPFADGYWRLEQRGADAVLEYDTNYGSGLAASYTDYITFKNLDAALLTAADLDGFDPHGALPTGKVITGTAASEGGPSDLMLRAAGLVGSNGADKIYGNGGNDDLYGRGGNDALIGGSGDDNLFGGLGIDVLQGGTGNDYLEAGSENDRAYGGAGNDTQVGVLADGHTALIDGGSGNDSLQVAFSATIGLHSMKSALTVKGGTGDDTIFLRGDFQSPVYYAAGGQTVDIWLGDGADTFKMLESAIGLSAPVVIHDWQAGVDKIAGDFWGGGGMVAGFTNYVAGSNPYADGHAKLVQEGADTVLYLDPNGGANSFYQSVRFIGVDRATFAGSGLGSFDFTVVPTIKAVQTLNGTDNNDFFYNGTLQIPQGAISVGTGGDFVYAGGKGDDVYYVDFLDKIVEKPGEGNDRIELFAGKFGAASSYTMPDNVEGLSLASPISSLKVIGNAGDNAIYLNVQPFNGYPNGDQVVEAGAGNDNVNTGIGNDRLDGGTGDDVLTGGAGNDTYVIDSSADHINEANGVADGVDTVRTTLASYTLGDSLENLVFIGTGNATLTGNAAGNVIAGGGGNDTIDGGAGADAADYTTAARAVTIDLGIAGAQNTVGAGNDTLISIENLIGSIRGDTLSGNESGNRIDGGSGADTLFGAGGRDILLGGTGNDRVDGGLGNDALYGGQGADTFVFSTAPGPANIDSIADFSSPFGDRLSLKASAFAGIGAVGALSADAFYAAAGASAAHDANDRIIYDTASGTLRFDADGTGTAAAITLAVLKGAPLLAATDLLVF